ncbi:unnamed protein product [Rotaria sp. Silwood1]|nr:unnamed protein product [Rotaria sp. Silwood1]CAF3432391.1 unnamed protein product [Rotaria sp. Silwood1]CAF3457978.1 unnamed protein product [Rotaria sp. Silwood1]CAF3458414.1 unnamed protein product [Rotaria sp. Silwood1]CAF3490362.1 unnamed protein product [Rotaria sp. Silwood1]
MPVITRAAALRAQTDGEPTYAANQGISLNLPNHELITSSLSSSIGSSKPTVSLIGNTGSATVENVNNDYPLVPVELSDKDDDDMHASNSNGIAHKPIVKGRITTGTLIRRGKMIFMNDCGYLHMNQTKDTIGWRCVRRDENCKSVFYTFKSIEQFNHWNGKFHFHSSDLHDTRKREILSKIKSRVLDKFIPTKAIIEDEYRKAKLPGDPKVLRHFVFSIYLSTDKR